MASLMKQILSEQARQSIPALDPSVAIAWLKGEITQAAIARVMEIDSGNAYPWLARSLRLAYQTGILKKSNRKSK